MQFYSFDPGDPSFEMDGWTISFQIVTLENTYGLASDHVRLETTVDGWMVTAERLAWAGQQEQVQGNFRCQVVRLRDGNLRVSLAADAPTPIRALKLIVRKLESVTGFDANDQPRVVPYDGLLEKYPNQLRLPLWLVQPAGGPVLGFRSEEAQARPKRFAAYQERMGPLAGTYTVECIHEEDARHFARQIVAPDWILGKGVQPDIFRGEHLSFAEQTLGLRSWESRADLPPWARDIQLSLILHGMHWSGYVFNTYDSMLEIIRYVAERINGQTVLAHLPGWEGRYYWQYGDYRPDPRLGGVDGFRRLCEGARALNVHLMPMFGATCANAWATNFHQFGPSSTMKSPTRNQFHGNQPDWDLSRAQDTGWQAWLNPGAPAWRRELTRQITELIDRYELDAVFLDCVEVWVNDPDYSMLDGYRALVSGLRDGRPDLLLTGEDWFDALLELFPIFQSSAYARQVPAWVARYARLYGHLADSEPSRGSTGVFEWGYRPYSMQPDCAPFIPTLAFTDGTLASAQAAVDEVINQIISRH
jgi:hypothetical protein